MPIWLPIMIVGAALVASSILLLWLAQNYFGEKETKFQIVREKRQRQKRPCHKAKVIYGRFVKDGFIYHDLRHSFNAYMRKAGVQESVIKEITGHSTREMFDRYNSIDGEDRRNAIKQLEDYLTKAYQNAYQEAISQK